MAAGVQSSSEKLRLNASSTLMPPLRSLSLRKPQVNLNQIYIYIYIYIRIYIYNNIYITIYIL